MNIICKYVLLAGYGAGHHLRDASVCGARTGTGNVKSGQPEDEAAILLGASGWQMFRRVTLPNIRWALLTAWCAGPTPARLASLARYRCFRPIRGETPSLPLQIELLEQDYNTVGSFTAAALLTLMAIITLFLKSMLQWRLENQENAQQEEHHEALRLPILRSLLVAPRC